MCEKSCSNVVMLSTPCMPTSSWKNKSDLISDLLLTAQNLVAGIASVSRSSLSDNRLEYKINVSANFPLVTLHYGLFSSQIDSEPNLNINYDKINKGKNLEKIINSLASISSENDGDHVNLKSNVGCNCKCHEKDKSHKDHNIWPTKSILNDKQTLSPKRSRNENDNVFVKKENPELIKVLPDKRNFNAKEQSKSESSVAFISDSNSRKEENYDNIRDGNPLIHHIKSDDKDKRPACMFSSPGNTNVKTDDNSNVSNVSADTRESKNELPPGQTDGTTSAEKDKDGFKEVVCLPVVALLNEQDNEHEAHSSNSNYSSFKDGDELNKPVPVQLFSAEQKKLYESQPSDKAFHCDYCPKTFSLLKVKLRHEKIHTGGKPYGCSFCKKSFNRKTSKEEHEKIHTGETPYPCSYCEKAFVSLHRRAQHEKIHTGEKPYVCSFCEKSFISLHRKSEHERIHTGEKPFSCGYCDKLFARIADKKQHERTHTGEKPYSCAYCDKSFTSITTKSKHERIHTDDRPFVCSYCGKSFISVSDKKQHEMIHTGERPYSCSYCQKSFITMREKKQHERTHTGERPHLCTYCQKPFISLREQKQHERTHTGEKPYSCSFCEKCFTSSSAKSKHERTHTGERLYFCSYCGKSFINVGDRNQHERIHTGERPFSCSYCPKSFISVREQKQHERTHTGEKPYSCRVCGNAFTSVSAKRKHEKNHLNEKPPPGEPEQITLI